MFKGKEIFKYVSMLAAVGIYLSLSFVSVGFKHQHVLADGSVLEHSHPYSHENGKDHHHSKKELELLALLSPNAAFTENQSSVCNVAFETEISEPISNESIILFNCIPQNILRGPPHC